jgi:hypothetical protein
MRRMRRGSALLVTSGAGLKHGMIAGGLYYLLASPKF